MNENHRRVLSVYLAHIERDLSNLRSELQEEMSGSDNILNVIKKDVSNDASERVLKYASLLEKGLVSAKLSLGLEPQIWSQTRRAEAIITDIWSTINDLRPTNLEKYGSLTRDDVMVLDSLVSILLQEIEKMMRVFN
jgi:hypothetical protein